jgi:hypothetical protein
VDDDKRARIKRVEISPEILTLTSDQPSASVSAAAFDGDNKRLEDLPASSFSWGTDNAKIATVDRNGVVKRVGVGECKLTAIAGTVSSNAVTVKCELPGSVITRT